MSDAEKLRDALIHAPCRVRAEQAEAHVARLRIAGQDVLDAIVRGGIRVDQCPSHFHRLQAALAATPAESAAELAALEQVADEARAMLAGMQDLGEDELHLPPALGDIERLRKAVAALDTRGQR